MTTAMQRWLPLLLTAALLVGFAAGGLSARNTTDGSAKVIRAERLEIVGARGQVIARIYEHEPGVAALELGDRVLLIGGDDNDTVGLSVGELRRGNNIFVGTRPDGSAAVEARKGEDPRAVFGSTGRADACIGLYAEDGISTWAQCN